MLLENFDVNQRPASIASVREIPNMQANRNLQIVMDQKTKGFNLQTYKVHALGDYVQTIWRYGMTNSYSTL